MDSSVGQLELALLRARLHTFERRFYRIAGPRYIDLKQARAEAIMHRARFMPEARGESLKARKTAAECAEECARATWKPAPDPDRLRHLHHELARHFHPDLASDGARRIVREKLMTEVNLAFHQEDLQRLELLAKALDRDENGDAARQLAELSGSPLNELRERTDYAHRHHHDLIADLAHHLAEQTHETRLRGARAMPNSGLKMSLIDQALSDLATVVSSRRLMFPADRSMGQLSVRAERNIDAPLKPVGEARGEISIPFGHSAILRLNGQSADLSPLRDLDKHGLIDEWPDFVRLDDEQVKSLAHFPGLEIIQLGRTQITGRVFDGFRSLHELRVLIVDDTAFDDEGLLRLEECIWMQRLDISLTQVTGPGLRGIRNMTALRELSLYGTKVSDADLTMLARIPGVRNLNLGLTGVSDACGEHIAHLSSLELLNLGGTAITDRILETLATLPALRELVLWETAITVDGLRKIQSFRALRYLDVDQSQVPPEALVGFREARPDVRLPSDIWAETPHP